MDVRTKKILLIVAAAILALAVIAVSATFISSCASTGRYEGYYSQAESYLAKGEHEKAVLAIEKALDIEETPAAYLMLANIYFSMGELDLALETLYIASYKFIDEGVSKRLEELKAVKLEQSSAQWVTLGGKKIDVKETIADFSSLKLTTVSDLIFMTELQNLTLADNEIIDITPVSSLEKLEYLNLSDNKIAGLRPLTLLKNLKTLYLDGNPITDFSPLYGLTSLETLSIRDIDITKEQLSTLERHLPNCNIHSDEPVVEQLTIGGHSFPSDVTELDLANLNITDISDLAACQGLKRLDLRSNSIKDLTPLSKLTELEWLCLWSNDVSDLAPLVGLKNLAYLDIDGNELTTIAPISSLQKLEELWISYNDISDFGHLKNLTALKRLGIKGTGLTDKDLETIKTLSLTELALEDNDELSAEAVEKLKEAMPDCYITHSDLLYSVELGKNTFRSDATEINAASSSVASLEGLEKFSALQTLILSGNNISDLSPLAELEELRVLELGADSSGTSNSVSDLTPLFTLTKLQTLNLSRNKVSDISPLANLTGLTELHLSMNSLNSISALSRLTNLKILSLNYCGLRDISALSSLKSLTHLDLEGNNINSVSSLKGLSNLKELYIGNNDITYSQLAELREALPNCSVYSDLQEPASYTAPTTSTSTAVTPPPTTTSRPQETAPPPDIDDAR